MFFFIITLSLLQSEVEALISINIDPEDLDHALDLITINNQQPITSNRKFHTIKIIIKKAIFGIIQLVGVMFSLVGAHIISLNFMPNVPNVPMQQPEIFFPIVQNETNKYKEMCNIDYGCNKNICWRSCNLNIDGKKSWCYASPTQREIQYCNHAQDCSVCWDCIEPCHI